MRKRIILIAALAAVTTVFTGASAMASAESTTDQESKFGQGPLLKSLNKDDKAEYYEVVLAANQTKKPATQTKKQTVYTVIKGDTLSKIADKHDTEWEKLWRKNTNLKHPDILKVGEKIEIPKEGEKLEPRDIPRQDTPEPSPSTSQEPENTGSSSPAPRPNSSPNQAVRGSSSGNTYAAGYCTWYAKSRRPDLPNNLGNANTWASRARAQGIPTGSTPRAGAIGQQGMHVVYIESVNGDGTVTVSEMNWKGRGIVSSRTTPASSFTYIY